MKFFKICLSLLCISVLVTPIQADTIENSEQNVTVKSMEDVEVVIQRLENLLIENPNLSQEEQNQFILEQITSPEFEVSTRIYSQYKSLTSEEKRLMKQYPNEVYHWKKTADWAYAETSAWYGYNRADDNSDAFRHCTWNMLMSKYISVSGAERWATAHEQGGSGLDYTMDMFNNRIGRNFYSSTMSYDQVIQRCKSLIREGKLRRIVRGQLVPTDNT